MRQRHLTALILLLALALRLGFALATTDYRPRHDDRDYDRLACGIVDGGGYPRLPSALPSENSCTIPGQEGARIAVSYRPPGLPYLLAGVYLVSQPLTSDRWTAARIALALIGTLAVWLAGLVAQRIWGWRRGLLTMALTAVCPPLIVVGGSLLSEIPFTAAALAAVLLMLDHRRRSERYTWQLFAAAAIAGLAWLMRSNGAVVIAVVALAAWPRPVRFTPGAIAPPLAAVLVALLVVAPWTIRNAVVIGHFIPVDSSAGPTLAGTYNRTSLDDPVRPGAWRLLTQVPDLRRLVKTYAGSDHEYDGQMRATALDYIAANPTSPLIVGWWGMQRMFFVGGGGPKWQAFSVSVASQRGSLGLLMAVSMWVYGIGALAGLLTRAVRRAPLWFWVLPVSFVLTGALVNSELRFAVGFLPWLSMLAALSLAALLSRRLRGFGEVDEVLQT